MFRKVNQKMWILLTLIPLSALNGCDDRVTQVARDATDRQAQQNTEMAQLNKEVASGTHQLVEADAKARQDIVGVHHDLQAERTRLDTSWKDLEDERRQIARQRTTQSMLVSVCELLGGVLLVTLLLGFCWYALVAIRHGDDTDAQLNELLVQEILPDHPPLLSANQPGANLFGHSKPDEHATE